MRRILLFFSLAILFCISEEKPSEFAKRLGRVLINLQNLKKEQELRKLQSTDTTDTEVNDEPISTTNTSAPLQFLDFSDFAYTTPANGKSPFTFKILFYFLGIPIPDIIYVPLKVTLGSLRALQSGEQDVEATCKPFDSTIPEPDSQNGRTKQFSCEAEANGEGTISSVAFDDSKKVRTVTNGETKSYGGGEIFFGNGAESYKDKIHTAPEIADYFTLKNGVVENTKSNDGQFNVNGALDKSIDPINNQALNLSISSSKNLTCQVSGSTENSVLTCDTNKESLSETNLHGKNGITTSDGKNYKVILTMKSENATVTEGEYVASSGPQYSKSSSGLSGGAIAGIVIACVVVLIAAAVAAIMLRKPTPPPVDNTTVSGLRTVENI